VNGLTRTLLRFLVLVGLYVAGVAFVVHFIVTPGSVTLFWPMAGLAFAAVLRYGLKWVVFVPVALLIAHLTPVSPVPHDFIPFSVAANTLGTLAGAWWVRRERLPRQMDIPFAFRALRGGLLMAAVSAAIGVSGMVASGMIPESAVADAMVKWFLGDVLGVLGVSPALLLLGFRVREEARDTAYGYGSEGESLAWNVALALSYLLMAWGGAYGSAYALGLSSLPLAVMVWSALRFPPLRTAVAVAATVLLIGVLVGLEIAGYRPPARPLDSAILLAYLCLNAMLPMILALAVHERRTATALMLRRASTDQLTGLPNRSAFEARVRKLLADPDEPPVALAYLDLDNFALINDTASHEAGDALIAGVAETLRAEQREGDLLAHLGADEFAMLLRNCNATMARERAQTLVRAVEITRCVWSNQVLQTTASIGVVPLRVGEAGFPELLSQADAACFAAKELGGNRVCLAGAVAGEDRTSAMRWAVRIRDSLDRHRFELYAQTIQPLQGLPPPASEPAQAHFEILLRMRDDRGDVLSPMHFMSAAERFRIGVRIDREVLDGTLAWLEQHPDAAARVGTCSINLTAEALVDEGFIGFVAERLRRSRFPADRLCLEITETSAVRDLERAQRFITEMRQLGCRFALDDFGTGFCSFAYLRALDVDYFKIDGSFVREMDSSPLAAEVVRSITHIAHLLDKKTVAEHTETRALIDSLRVLGVDFAQGYAIDRPEPIAQYFERLAQRDPRTAAVALARRGP
jgi:diguanylate cyclase (GGDEF)-like protein